MSVEDLSNNNNKCKANRKVSDDGLIPLKSASGFWPWSFLSFFFFFFLSILDSKCVYSVIKVIHCALQPLQYGVRLSEEVQLRSKLKHAKFFEGPGACDLFTVTFLWDLIKCCKSKTRASTCSRVMQHGLKIPPAEPEWRHCSAEWHVGAAAGPNFYTSLQFIFLQLELNIFAFFLISWAYEQEMCPHPIALEITWLNLHVGIWPVHRFFLTWRWDLNLCCVSSSIRSFCLANRSVVAPRTPLSVL